MKKVYLTIDEAPSVDFKKKIKFMKRRKIPAIIFCIGKQIERHKEDVIYAIKNGFVIGNHSFTHPHFSRISFSESGNEIKKTDELIDSLYKKAKVERPVKLFRFPYGNKGGKHASKLQVLLKNLGYRMPEFHDIHYHFFHDYYKRGAIDFCWTFNVMEYTFSSLTEIYKRLDEERDRLGIEIPKKGGSLDKKSSEIIIIHDEIKTTKFFCKIINHLILMKIKFCLPKF
ncbi:polysaccharide deacetylase family protein [Candidatus Aenigmatarchaeota archaeon]